MQALDNFHHFRQQTVELVYHLDRNGVPAGLDLWESIEAKVAESPARRSDRKWLSGRKKLVFLIAGAVVFGMGAYSASGYAYDFFQRELPGIDAKVEGGEVGQSKTIDGATVNIEWTYADTEFVVVGYSVDDHRDDRMNGQNEAYLEPVWFDEQIGNPPMDEPHLDITDASGNEFDVIGGSTQLDDEKWWPWPLANTVVFETPDGFRPAAAHRFEFEIPLREMPYFPPGKDSVRIVEEPVTGPYGFDFTIPVKSAATIPVNQTVEANGIEMTLKSVVDSPARPEATVCMGKSPDADYSWWPMSNGKTDPRELGGGCWIVGADSSLDQGTTSVTITSLDGISKETEVNTKPGLHRVEQKIVDGPWRFEVELPED